MSSDYVEIGNMYSDVVYRCLPNAFFVILCTTGHDVNLLLTQTLSHYRYQTVQSQKSVLWNLHHIKNFSYKHR
jgi:hypothetical protein